MRQYWKRWVGLAVFVLVLGTAFVMLGRWQLDRLDQRRERNAAVVAHESSPVTTVADAFSHPVAEADQWQRVAATGRFDYDHEYLVRYRHLDGRNGFEIVTPFVTDGRTVLVDRGFVDVGPGVAPATRPGPTGEATVTGYVRRNEVGKDNAIAPRNREVRLINAPAIARDSGLPLVDGYLQLISVEPGQDASLLPLGTPSLDEGPHLSYALQWFTFCAIAVLGLFVLIRGDIRDRRKAEARAKAAASGPGATVA